MKPIEECTVGIVGMGLMGGAVAMALRNRCGVMRNRLLACDADAETLAAAEAAGLIEKGWKAEDDLAEMLSACDLVFLCLNPSTLLKFLERWEGAFKSGALITDIAGIKGNIASAAEKFRPDLDFIPGHPMAGAERGGFSNAALCDFTGKNYILTPLERNKGENLDFLKTLIRRMGFGRITETSAAGHDRKIAFTSQLCHVIAAALIDCEADTAITRFGGGSFEDLTRIAMLNAPMWTELFIENREALLERIEQFEESLDALKALISGGAAEELEKRLALVRERRAAMNG
ncbi:prephenate dehydrogenase [Spirochaetia bacterium]|nr:prephenate dehydrogenase [Spirochaetia bacterium]